jgi:beta-N-acetylhexosaminidase
MTLGPLMVDLQRQELAAEEREVLLHPAVGGVILFSRNYHSPEQITELAAAIHALREPHLLVAVDQEGGRVQRFRDGFTHLPPVSLLGTLYDREPARARQLARVTGWLMAAELRAVGVDISFAPVLDLDQGISTVIGDRALHGRPEVVADLAHAYQYGMQQAGMVATGKHFPGHGGVEADSHLALPVDPRPLRDIRQWDLLAFERMIHYGLAGIMMAHVVYPEVDSLPAGFSRIWIRDVLRGQLGFHGIVFSDDLSMAAAAAGGGYEERARLALEAGCDMLLVCNAPVEAGRLAEALQGHDDPVAHTRMARMHGRPAPDRNALHADRRWQQAIAAVQGYDRDPQLGIDLPGSS